MYQLYKKYKWTIVTGLLLTWIILTPSHFQKGGVNEIFYFAIALFVTFISALICLTFDNYSLIGRLLISIPFAFVSLSLMTFILGPIIVDFFYSDKTWSLWETKHRIFVNSVYYGLNAIILTLIGNISFRIGQRIRKGYKTKTYS